MESAQARIRPFRFAFLVEPKDKKALQRVFEMTSSLWGGIFNYFTRSSNKFQTDISRNIKSRSRRRR